jgi:hypothetical protein
MKKLSVLQRQPLRQSQRVELNQSREAQIPSNHSVEAVHAFSEEKASRLENDDWLRQQN